MFTVKKVIDGKEVKLSLEHFIQVSAFLTEGFELVVDSEHEESTEPPKVNKGGRPKKS